MFESIYNFIQSKISILWDYSEYDTIIFDQKIESVNEDDINNLIKEVQTDIEIEKLEKRYKKLAEEIYILNKQEEEEKERLVVHKKTANVHNKYKKILAETKEELGVYIAMELKEQAESANRTVTKAKR